MGFLIHGLWGGSPGGVPGVPGGVPWGPWGPPGSPWGELYEKSLKKYLQNQFFHQKLIF